MNIIEKAEQLKGLAQRNPEEAGSPLLAQALELLEEMARKIVGLEEEQAALTEHVGDLDDVLEELCEEIYGDEDEMFEVECPNCGELIQIDEGILEDGGIACPGCEETLEFEFDCDCGACGEEDCPGHE